VITRRKFIAAGALTSATIMLPTHLIGAGVDGEKSTSRQKSVSDYLTVIQFSDPRFSSELDRLFPGLRQDPVFKRIETQAVLITNVGGRNIRAHDTSWTAMTSSGTIAVIRSHYFHPRGRHPNKVHFGVKGNKTCFTGKIPLIKPGMTRLLTPYFNWSPNYYLTHSTPNWQKLFTSNTSRRKFLAAFSNATNIEVTVNTVIFNRKHMVGSDNGNLSGVYRKSRNAEHDEAVGILKAIKKGASMDKVATILHNHATKKIPKSDGNAEKTTYLSVRKRQAKVLLRRLKRATRNGEPEHFINTLNYLKKQRKTTTGLKKKALKALETGSARIGRSFA
jgi:ribosomal protein L14E/L6E/L27E